MKHIASLLLLVLSMGLASPMLAQTCLPTMRVTGDEYVDAETSSYDGNAPMHAVFEANPRDIGDYEPLYEWRFSHQNEQTPFLVRYDEKRLFLY